MKIWKIAQNKDIDFFTTRKEGASKVAKSAKEKGGPSILTMWHFNAKSKPYSEVIQAIKDSEDIEFYDTRCKKILKELNKKVLGQRKFQEIMGELEVWGEAFEYFSEK
jgi:hypothetical protein